METFFRQIATVKQNFTAVISRFNFQDFVLFASCSPASINYHFAVKKEDPEAAYCGSTSPYLSASQSSLTCQPGATLFQSNQSYKRRRSWSMASQRAIIYGGRGGLGCVIVKHFKQKGWWVCSVDINANEEADANILVNPNDTWLDQEKQVCANVEETLTGNKVEAIINMAG